MKHRTDIILTVLLFSSLITFSQERDTYQTDSVMKSNNVKSKIRYPENTISKARQIYNFDKQGRLTEYILTDNGFVARIKINIFSLQFSNLSNLFAFRHTI